MGIKKLSRSRAATDYASKQTLPYRMQLLQSVIGYSPGLKSVLWIRNIQELWRRTPAGKSSKSSCRAEIPAGGFSYRWREIHCFSGACTDAGRSHLRFDRGCFPFTVPDERPGR